MIQGDSHRVLRILSVKVNLKGPRVCSPGSQSSQTGIFVSVAMLKLTLTSNIEIGRTSLVEGSTHEIVDGASEYGGDGVEM